MRLALEWTSATCSMALNFVDGRRELRSLAAPRFQTRWMHQSLLEWLIELQVRAGDLEEVVVGVGPGNYTGMRMAVTTAKAIAMGGDTIVNGISSGRAALRRLIKESPGGRHIFAGDARRGRWWAACADVHTELVSAALDWTLYTPESLLAEIDIAKDHLWSPEPDRLSMDLEWTPAFPLASDLLDLAACDSLRADGVRPIYLQKAV